MNIIFNSYGLTLWRTVMYSATLMTLSPTSLHVVNQAARHNAWPPSTACVQRTEYSDFA
jgi:hypothetical protein